MPARARSRARAPASRSSACRTRRTPPSRATSPRSSAARPARSREARRLAARSAARRDASCTRPRCCSTAACSSRRCSRARDGRRSTAGSPPKTRAAARLLEGADLDLAVARGAAYYGYVRRGERRAHPRRHGARVLRRRRIGDAGRPRHGAAGHGAVRRAVRHGGRHRRRAARRRNSAWWSASRCTSASSARRCAARTRSATCSNTGSPDELQELEEIQATLPAEGRTPGEVVQVKLHARVTEAGTLELEAMPRGRPSAGRSSSTCAAASARIRAWACKCPRARKVRARGTASASTSAPATRCVAYAPAGLERYPRASRSSSWSAPGEVAARPLLPSLRYHSAPGELDAGAICNCPGGDDPAGVPTPSSAGLRARWARRCPDGSWRARRAGCRTRRSTAPRPSCRGARPTTSPKISPVAASASYLAHLRAAWNAALSRRAAGRQDVVLTVPASFDEGARALTLEAARMAGLPHAAPAGRAAGRVLRLAASSSRHARRRTRRHAARAGRRRRRRHHRPHPDPGRAAKTASRGSRASASATT